VLYNWPAAMDGEKSSNPSDGAQSGVQGACPSGWYLPGDTEWKQLEDYLITNGYNYDGTIVDNKIAKAMAADRPDLWNYAKTTSMPKHSETNPVSQLFRGLSLR